MFLTSNQTKSKHGFSSSDELLDKITQQDITKIFLLLFQLSTEKLDFVVAYYEICIWQYYVLCSLPKFIFSCIKTSYFDLYGFRFLKNIKIIVPCFQTQVLVKYYAR